jgi:uncharacterized membrane protein
MKTHSQRIKENPKTGAMTILAIIFAFTPIGLVFYFIAKKQEGDSTLLKVALVISIISLIGWVIGLLSWGLWYWTWSALWLW